MDKLKLEKIDQATIEKALKEATANLNLENQGLSKEQLELLKNSMMNNSNSESVLYHLVELVNSIRKEDEEPIIYGKK